MKLLTKELQKALPPLYSTENEEDPMVVCKFFHPRSNWTWYVTEASLQTVKDGEELCIGLTEAIPEGAQPIDVLMFGLVDGFEAELGYISLRELASVRDDWGLGVERDIYWTPKRLSEVRESL